MIERTLKLLPVLFVALAAGCATGRDPGLVRFLELGIGDADYRRALRYHPNDIYPVETISAKLTAFEAHLMSAHPDLKEIPIVLSPRAARKMVLTGRQHQTGIVLTMDLLNVPVGECIRSFCLEFDLSWEIRKGKVYIDTKS